eukprot:PhM_4_TR11329/c0_g1_i1/m.103995
MQCSPSTCFFPLEGFDANTNNMMNKLTLTCSPSVDASGVEFSVRATHQYELECEPKAGRLLPGGNAELVIRWKGEAPKNAVTFEGLRPQKQPRLRLDFAPSGTSTATPRTLDSVIVDVCFAFPTEATVLNKSNRAGNGTGGTFCYSLDGGNKWWDSRDIKASSVQATPPEQQQQQHTTLDMTTSDASALVSASTSDLTAALERREQERALRLRRLVDREREFEMEVEAEAMRRENTIVLSQEVHSMKGILTRHRQEKMQLAHGGGGGVCVIA